MATSPYKLVLKYKIDDVYENGNIDISDTKYTNIPNSFDNVKTPDNTSSDVNIDDDTMILVRVSFNSKEKCKITFHDNNIEKPYLKIFGKIKSSIKKQNLEPIDNTTTIDNINTLTCSDTKTNITDKKLILFSDNCWNNQINEFEIEVSQHSKTITNFGGRVRSIIVPKGMKAIINGSTPQNTLTVEDTKETAKAIKLTFNPVNIIISRNLNCLPKNNENLIYRSNTTNNNITYLNLSTALQNIQNGRYNDNNGIIRECYKQIDSTQKPFGYIRYYIPKANFNQSFNNASKINIDNICFNYIKNE